MCLYTACMWVGDEGNGEGPDLKELGSVVVIPSYKAAHPERPNPSALSVLLHQQCCLFHDLRDTGARQVQG